jgi:hypothetical protein
MQGAALHASVRTYFGRRTHNCRLVISRRGARISLDHWQAISIYLLTPESLAHAIEQSFGHRTNIEIAGSFVGSQIVTAGVDIREQSAPSFPLTRANVFIEVLPAGLRFVLSCDCTYLPPNQSTQSVSQDPSIRRMEIVIEFVLPDVELSSAVQAPAAEKLVEEILSAKLRILSQKSILSQG